jgi:hypothetical protein
MPAKSGFWTGLEYWNDVHIRRPRGRRLSAFIVLRHRSPAIQNLLALHAAGGDQQLKFE